MPRGLGLPAGRPGRLGERATGPLSTCARRTAGRTVARGGAERVLADVGYYEPWWMQILKSLVIFFVVFNLVPMRPARRAQAARPLPAPLRPQPRRPVRRRSSRSPTSSSCSPRSSSARARRRRACSRSRPVISMVTAVARDRDHPVRRHRRHLRHARPASTASTSRSARCSSSRFGAIAFYGLMLGGWASGSKYSFLGSMRAAAQLISYEVAQGLALVGVVMTAQSLSLVGHRRGAGRHVVLRPAVRRLHRSS